MTSAIPVQHTRTLREESLRQVSATSPLVCAYCSFMLAQTRFPKGEPYFTIHRRLFADS